MGPEQRPPAVYRIGAVAQLTGLSANTIRTWERRHAAVAPQRTEGGGRLYTDADVERLQLLKALTDAGDSISLVAALSTEELFARQEPRPPPRTPRPPGNQVRAAVLHRTLGDSLARGRPWGWRIESSETDLAPFVEAASALESVDVMILQLSLLGGAPEAAYERCVDAFGPQASIVVYDFAPQRLLEALADAGARLLRAPVDMTVLERLTREQLELGPPGPFSAPESVDPSPPLYDDDQLARLRAIRSVIDCECPHHLAHLAELLVAFERYSETCEDRSPGDAEIHRALRLGTGRARMQIEELLGLVLRWERISI